MFYAHQPSRQLQPFVQCYLEADYRNSSEKGENTLFPNGLSGIFFNFGNMGRLIIKEEYKTPFVSVFGQIDQHFTVVHWPGFYSLGVLLKPCFLSWLLRVNMSEFTNKAFDGQLIRGDLKLLHEQLEQTPGAKKKIEIIETFFIKILSSRSYSTSLADRAVYLIDRHTMTSVQLASYFNISQRHLEIQFKKSIGLSPKTYSLILRFKRIEQQLKNSCTPSWKDLSFVNEFHDQNHFIKDFKRFTGLTPSTYLLGNIEMGRSYLTAR